jgi:hypothetical protein
MDTSPGPHEASRRLASKTKSAAIGLARIFSLKEWAASLALRTRHQQDSDQFNARELEHLRFNRWLYQTGRLAE